MKNKMKAITKKLLIIIIALNFLGSCINRQEGFIPTQVYKSEDLIITQITENSFEHTSFKQTNDFGNVPCNGIFIRNGDEIVVFDTPINNKSSEELIKWIKEELHCEINAIIPTHFHDDCLGGLQAFHDNNISSYAYFKTVERALENDFTLPKNSFRDSLILKVGNQTTITKFFGEGHTKDNVVTYVPSENLLFGGCLIKSLDATKGYLDDANVEEWSSTVAKIKNQYPNLKIVVPGHGDFGDTKLLDYTIELFKP